MASLMVKDYRCSLMPLSAVWHPGGLLPLNRPAMSIIYWGGVAGESGAGAAPALFPGAPLFLARCRNFGFILNSGVTVVRFVDQLGLIWSSTVLVSTGVLGMMSGSLR